MWLKDELRKNNLKIRQQMKHDECVQKSAIICEYIAKMNEFVEAESVLLYSSIKNEVDLTELLCLSLALGKKVYFPKTYKEEIKFYRVCSKNDFVEGLFHVPEPANLSETFDDSKGIVIVPGLAFSSGHHRIGFGKGYYDRFLKDKDNLFTVGVGYDFQFENDFKADKFDIPLNKLVSNRGEEHQNGIRVTL